jgi:membrane associated rhomboid family serine protease
VPATVGLLLAAMLVASVWAATDRAVAGAAALMPVAVWRGQAWRLVTWALVQPDPGTLLFGGFMLWWIGQQLSYAWSERRFVARVLAYTLAPGVATALLALVWPGASTVAHLGMWPLVNALLVSWAMLHPDAQVNVWGVLPLTGRSLALLVTGGTVLYAVFSGFAEFAPHLSALAVAWFQARGAGLGGGRPWRRARRWWAERAARRRARHLKVVRKNGSGDGPTWLN